MSGTPGMQETWDRLQAGVLDLMRLQQQLRQSLTVVIGRMPVASTLLAQDLQRLDADGADRPVVESCQSAFQAWLKAWGSDVQTTLTTLRDTGASLKGLRERLLELDGQPVTVSQLDRLSDELAAIEVALAAAFASLVSAQLTFDDRHDSIQFFLRRKIYIQQFSCQ